MERIGVHEEFCYNIKNPSIGGAGIPEEEFERRSEEYRTRSIAYENAYEEASKITSDAEKIKLLKRLGFRKIKTDCEMMNLDDPFLLSDRSKKFLYGMYQTTINQIKKLKQNPISHSTLAERVLKAFS
jgi:hypothetical protein